MNNISSSILAKSTSASSESSAGSQEMADNAVTMKALQEASDIMSGKKKVKWNRFQPGISRAEAKNELEKTLGS